tara:strand:+ start:278 stop:643 length:366 start_codon:yes stop_codon:yes gene_type:complete
MGDKAESKNLNSLTSISSFRNGLILLLAFNAIDAVYTLIWIQNSLAVEANPLMVTALEFGPWAFIGIKIVLASMGVFLLWKLRHIRLARVSVILPAVFYSIIVGMHIAHSLKLGFGMSLFN